MKGPTAFALAVFVVSCASATPVMPPNTASRIDFSCSWGLLSNGDELNVAYPDSNATYWAQTLRMKPGDSITVRGSFPGARYFSFISYDPSGTPYSESPSQMLPWPPSPSPSSTPDLNSEIYDAQLAARTGQNYFISSRPAPLPPTGTYVLHVTSGPPSLTRAANPRNPRSVAVLAAPTPGPSSIGGLTGWLLYRVYAPYVGHPGTFGTPQYYKFIKGGVSLPSISRIWALGSPRPVPTLPPCPSRLYEPFVKALAVPLISEIIRQAPTPAPEPLFQYNGGGGLFPNPNNKYVYGTTTWKRGRLIIIAGLAPTFPNTNSQGIVQKPPTDVRYWSTCTNKDISPAPVVFCADDQHTHLFGPSPGTLIPPATDELFPGTSGPQTTPPPGAVQYAYLISSAADKPAVLDPNVTWLPWFKPIDEPPSPGSKVPGMLIMRNMLSIFEFIDSIQNIPTYGKSAAAQLLASLNPPQDPKLARNPVVQAVAVMGLYYPRAIYCRDTLFEKAYSKKQRLGEAIHACARAAARVRVPP